MISYISGFVMGLIFMGIISYIIYSNNIEECKEEYNKMVKFMRKVIDEYNR